MLEVSTFQRVQEVETRIGQIESKIAALSGRPSPAASTSNTAFAARLEAARTSQVTDASSWDGLIQEASAEYGLEEDLLRAVMQSESGGNAGAVSSAGAVGLMQLMPSTAASVGVTDPFDPRQNMMGGARYLKGLIDRFGSTELAVAAYNAGPGAVRRYGGIPPYEETQRYVANVMSRYQGR